ncbi:SAM-dependent methyltransferase [Actinomycetes bacterium KLBMP 9797]
MTDRPAWAPDEIDTGTATLARAYDYLLGGSHNFAADRELARQIVQVLPDAKQQARVNRAFLHRAVRFALDQGIRQFLDLGSGIPTVGNVHEIAQKVDPEARVAYVDIDPVAVAHSRQILSDNPYATVIREDLAHPDAILTHPDVRGLLDFDRPVALLMVAVLHAVRDESDPYGAVARLTDALAPGSLLVIAHATHESRPEEYRKLMEMSRHTTTPLAMRTHAEILRFFDGFEFVEPGLVWVPTWRPESDEDVPAQPEMSVNYGGVGRKP